MLCPYLKSLIWKYQRQETEKANFLSVKAMFEVTPLLIKTVLVV